MWGQEGLCKNGICGIARKNNAQHHRKNIIQLSNVLDVNVKGDWKLKEDSMFKVMADWKKKRDINSSGKVGNKTWLEEGRGTFWFTKYFCSLVSYSKI